MLKDGIIDWAEIKIIGTLVFFIVTYIFIITSNEKRIKKMEERLDPAKRDDEFMTRIVCQEFKENCNKNRILELEILGGKIDAIKTGFEVLKLDIHDLKELIIVTLNNRKKD